MNFCRLSMLMASSSSGGREQSKPGPPESNSGADLVGSRPAGAEVSRQRRLST
jgi:hypothetical protein